MQCLYVSLCEVINESYGVVLLLMVHVDTLCSYKV